MEENLLPAATPEALSAPAACINCGNPQIADGYTTPLCNECRNTLSRYPVPRWIWLFAAGTGVLLLVSLSRLPLYFGTIVHLRKAQNAIEARNYMTAQKESLAVLKKNPDHLEANAYSFIAAAYNMEGPELTAAYAKLEGKEFDDQDLLKQVEAAIDRASLLYFNDTAAIQMANIISFFPPDIQVTYADSILHGNTMETSSKLGFGMMLVNKLMDRDANTESIAILENMKGLSPDDYAPLYGEIAPRRRLGDYDGALAICRKLLELNHEDVSVIAQQAKVEVARQHYKEAAALATKALALKPGQVTALEALALVYHFNGQKEESKKLRSQILAAEAASGDSTVSVRLTEVLNGATTYR